MLAHIRDFAPCVLRGTRWGHVHHDACRRSVVWPTVAGGSTSTDNGSGSTTTYTYNKRNRLETATAGALVWGHAYNGREQLVRRNLNVGGVNLTHFVYDIFGNVLAETVAPPPASTANTSGCRKPRSSRRTRAARRKPLRRKRRLTPAGLDGQRCRSKGRRDDLSGAREDPA